MDRASADALPLAGSSAPAESSGLLPALLAVAATALSVATWDGSGTYTSTAMRLLAICIAAAGAGLLVPFAGTALRRAEVLSPVLLACACVQFAALLWRPIDYPVDRLSPSALRTMMFLITGAAVVSGSLCGGRSPLGKWALPIVLLIQAALGIVLIRRLPTPGIDVLMFQRSSCEALLQRLNPYAIRFPDPYPPEASAMFYGPGVSVNGILQFGYPYMPITLLMALPGHLLGDVRYAGLACVVIATALIGYGRRNPEGKAAAALLAFSPIAPLLVTMAWTESYVLLLLAITCFCYWRKSRLLPYALGLLLVSKQYMPALAPLALLLLPRPWSLRSVWSFAWKAAAAGALVTLPLVLWNPQAFWDSAITLQTRQPYRPDALSFLIWAHPAHPAKWVWVPFAALFATMAVCLAVSLRRRVSFPLALALCLLAFFATNKQAFANYYYLVIGSLWCAVVAGAGAEEGSGSSCTQIRPSAARSEA